MTTLTIHKLVNLYTFSDFFMRPVFYKIVNMYIVDTVNILQYLMANLLHFWHTHVPVHVTVIYVYQVCSIILVHVLNFV